MTGRLFVFKPVYLQGKRELNKAKKVSLVFISVVELNLFNAAVEIKMF
jgi:hypothetical protein